MAFHKHTSIIVIMVGRKRKKLHVRKNACLMRSVSLISQFSRDLREVKLNLQTQTPQGPTVLGQVHGLFYVIDWNITRLALFERVVVKHVQPRGKLGHRQRGFTVELAVALSRGDNSLTPVLPAVVIGIKEINAHNLITIQRKPLDSDGVPAEKACGAVGHCNTGRLRINNRNIAVVKRVIGGIKISNKPFEVFQTTGEYVDGYAKSVAHMLSLIHISEPTRRTPISY